MSILKLEELTNAEYQLLMERPHGDENALNERVAAILHDVRKTGDEAIRKYSRQFDGIELASFNVSESEISGSLEKIPNDLRSAIETAQTQIIAFHAPQEPKGYEIESITGVKLKQLVRPMRRVGIYVPKNLISSLLMAAIPVQIAGVREIAVCSPPDAEGRVPIGIRATCELLDITELYAAGGAQAIGALAYGTESIPKVQLIAGPGNAYVTTAKRLVCDDVKIDILAGPSEILLVVEKLNGIPRERLAEWASAELKAQLEHGPGTTAYALTDDALLAEALFHCFTELETSSRNFAVLHYADRARLIDFINDFAPEHLGIWSDGANDILNNVESAGSVFIGPWSPVALGDYVSGTNHILPTSRNARFSGGVSVETFVKRISVQEISELGLNSLAPAGMALAKEEGLSAHARSLKIRAERESNA